ncbi:MAG: nucleotidyltransferase family protein [Tabrizicola sp.]|uniref:nucleotidyltransferase family protein n=1 Tax=Tabrizicola sp. TaxID=2005166 RepID=UPI002734BDA1|nr:nucleotidyltransferase family protein [Tabrizicola sp.]MDP3264432.1 nucleotidyltransferase family protein [Tabrizicola sp.]MDP3646478.1 nucleotidyltransferase family protein [Paracoccaceae bacterium]
MQPTVHIAILAAGASSRMRGRDKLLEPIAGMPLIRRVAEAAVATGQPVYVMLPANDTRRRAALDGLSVLVISVQDAERGMSRSLMRAVHTATLRSAAATDGLMVLPADMPGLTPAALTLMVVAFLSAPTLVHRATDASGQPGHPAIFPKDLWPALAALDGDEGGRAVLRQHQARVRLTPLPGDMATLDLDTPEAWAAYRASGR